LNLPPTWEQARGAIERALRLFHQKGQDVDMGVARVIIRSPNGTRYAITVGNTGTLGTTAL